MQAERVGTEDLKAMAGGRGAPTPAARLAAALPAFPQAYVVWENGIGAQAGRLPGITA
jgi:hypothetical protein